MISDDLSGKSIVGTWETKPGDLKWRFFPFKDAVSPVGDAVGFDHKGAFEIGLMSAEVVREADVVAEQDSEDVEADFVDKTGPQILG